jgi:hypothetical protein
MCCISPVLKGLVKENSNKENLINIVPAILSMYQRRLIKSLERCQFEEFLLIFLFLDVISAGFYHLNSLIIRVKAT